MCIYVCVMFGVCVRACVLYEVCGGYVLGGGVVWVGVGGCLLPATTVTTPPTNFT